MQDQLAAKENEELNVPFYFVHTRMPASLPAVATTEAGERHARICQETAIQNKQISEFPALLDCLSMPMPGRVPAKMIFQIYSCEIVSRSLDRALEGFKPSVGSHSLQIAAQFLLGPFAAGFIAFATMEVAYQACDRLGIITALHDHESREVLKQDFRSINEWGLNRFLHTIVRACFLSMPVIIFEEIVPIAIEIGELEFVGNMGYFVAGNAIAACVNAVMESERWLKIAAIIRRHAFRSHMQWITANANDLWLDS